MRLRTALNEFKHDRSDSARYPGERRTIEGAFSGYGDRLVHIDPGGYLRDFSSPLSELYGIDRSRLGIRTPADTYWFDELETIRQHYYRETNLVETEYDMGEFTVHQYDLTLGRAHVTHVELRGAVPSEASLVAFLTLAPEGQDARVARLIHEDGGPHGSKAVEVFHHHEHDYVTASTGLDEVHGQIPERFSEMLDDDPISFPRDIERHRYEDTHLSGDILVTAPLEQTGRAARTTLVSQLSDHDEITREEALADLRNCVTAYETADDLRAAAQDRTSVTVPDDAPRQSLVRTDLRVLDLLLAPTGAHITAPDFDPFFVNSGGYGYCWFGEDAVVATHLLEADRLTHLDVDDRFREKAAFYCEGQLDDGTWPHRVWASDGALAPGWANAKVEHDETSGEYQAHQTAQVTTFLATFLRERREQLSDDAASDIRESIRDAVAAMDDSLDQNGLPETCQNVWEDMMGQFTHTAATYLEAYSAVARASVAEELQDSARQSADRVYEALDELWDDTTGAYALRLDGGIPDRRLDASTFVLVDAFKAYASCEGRSLSETDLDRLRSHVGSLLNSLYRNPPGNQVGGLIRYEGDRWRTGEQTDEKIWSLTTAMGATAAATLGTLLEGYGQNGEAFFKRASDLYNLLREEGPLTTDAGYLSAQVYDDGTLDGATPLGPAHAIRLRATMLLAEENALPTAPAPSGPEDKLRWTTGEKYGVGTVADHGSPDPSRVWFTLTKGALTEARFPRIDLMNLRTLDFLVRCPDEEYMVRTHRESRAGSSNDTVDRRVEPAVDEALLFRHVITEQSDGHGHEWRLTVEYAVDPDHDAIVADVSFESMDGLSYDVFAVADTALSAVEETDRGLRLGSRGDGYHLVARNTEAYTTTSSSPVAVDENGDRYSVAVALATDERFDWATVGVAGGSHLQAVFAEEKLPSEQESVDSDHVVLVGRLGSGTEIQTQLALGFADKADTAAALGEAEGALTHGYETVQESYVESWKSYLEDKPLPDTVTGDLKLENQYRTALMSLLAVEDKTYSGSSIASPSVPWGEAVDADKTDGSGYNYVWARDLYQVFTVFDIVDDVETAVSQLEFIYGLQQDEDGFVPQNTYVNGVTHWGGEQMDNISLPQVMAYHLWERDITFAETDYDYSNVARSANYVAENGPSTAQDRWEEESGYSPSSIAAEIAGLAAAGKIAIDTGNDADALIWLSLADQWTNSVEEWTATRTGTDKHDRTPYYVRVTRNGDPEAGIRRTLANGGPTLDERNIIDGGFLELVRLGIKPWNDDTIQNSLVEVDRTIRVDLDAGAAFYRYNGDGYGERERGDQGGPWSSEHNGKGRLWPLLTGERGEYELLNDDSGESDQPEALLEAMAEFANSGRMIAEQVWDRQYSTEYDWKAGEGTGSATPLAWAMSQYVRLAHSIDAGEPIETPTFVRDRYLSGEVNRQDRSPALRVDTRFRGDEIIFSGETTGALVAVKTPVETTLVEPADGSFEVALEMAYGENTCIVAVASERNLETASTTVSRFTL